MNQAILSLSAAIMAKRPAILATVIDVNGASPAKIGAQIVLLDDGTTAGTVGGGKLEAAILADAKTALAEDKPRLAHYRLTEKGDDSIGTLCGGEGACLYPALSATPANNHCWRGARRSPSQNNGRNGRV